MNAAAKARRSFLGGAAGAGAASIGAAGAPSAASMTAALAPAPEAPLTLHSGTKTPPAAPVALAAPAPAPEPARPGLRAGTSSPAPPAAPAAPAAPAPAPAPARPGPRAGTFSPAPPAAAVSRLPPRSFYARRVKRLFDLSAVLLAAPLVAPLILLLALRVALDPRSGGPRGLRGLRAAFHGQTRIGRGGRPFRMWKIRTMVPDAEARLAGHLAENPAAAAEWAVRQKLENDPRVIPAGRFLRAASLDELPQLWNVLIGDMSLVGPRPFLPEQQRLYPGSACYALRPGLTGLWQVGARDRSGFAARAAEDAEYLARIGLLLDLAILARTVRVVLDARGR